LSGGFANVYRANETSQEVLAELGFAEAVVKATVLRVVEQGVNGVTKKSVKRERKAYGLLRDLGFHRTLLFPNIVLPGKGGRGSDPLYMTMPFCDCDLTKFDFENGGQVIELMTALADGVGHLHEHGIAHFDIKGENVLVRDKHFLLSDFGVAVKLGATGTYNGPFAGTTGEVAPEMQELWAGGTAELNGFKCDVFAIGKTVATCITKGRAERLAYPVNGDFALIQALIQSSMHTCADQRPSTKCMLDKINTR
jgi:serine/threonine protein kinase